MSCCHYLGLLIEVSAGLINPIAQLHLNAMIMSNLTYINIAWLAPCLIGAYRVPAFFFFSKMIHPLALLHSLKSLHFTSCYFPLSLWFVRLLSLQLGQAELNEGFFFKHSSVWAAGKGLDLAAARTYTRRNLKLFIDAFELDSYILPLSSPLEYWNKHNYPAIYKYLTQHCYWLRNRGGERFWR